MKIQCDVCNKEEASVFCSADEAALCAACDHCVHHANKLASKHLRFSLLHPPTKQAPLCDICQETKAFLFCQQDRAILCRECDTPIHKANEHTRKHNRFLLTGIKLSPLDHDPFPTSSSSSFSSAACDDVPNFTHEISIKKPVYVHSANPIPNPRSKATKTITSSPLQPPAEAAKTNDGNNNHNHNYNQFPTGRSTNNNGLTSSISEYLEMLPDWQAEDFLDSSSPSPFDFCEKMNYNEVMSFWDSDLESNASFFPLENIVGSRVPQAPQHDFTQTYVYSETTNTGVQLGFKESKHSTNIVKSHKRWRDDSCFTVPQIRPHYNASNI